MSVNALGLAVLRAMALFVFWLLLVDAVDTPNLVTGGVCALLAAALASRVYAARSIHAKVSLKALRFIYRPFALIVADSVRVTKALALRVFLRRRSPGHFRAARYGAVSDSPDHVGRRILTEWGASAGPNRYVIGIDPDRRLLLVHELVRSSSPLDPLELG